MKKMGLKAYLKHVYLVFCEKYAVWFFLGAVALALFSRYFGFAYNFSNSLPHKVYLINKTETHLYNFKHGDFVAFYWKGDFYPENTHFLKQVAGLPNDNVSRKTREFFINGQSVGVAKETAQSGEKLAVNPFEGVIPRPYIWVKADNEHSLDSRYEMTGLIHAGQIMGKAYPLF